jgi:hypothetical protein
MGIMMNNDIHNLIFFRAANSGVPLYLFNLKIREFENNNNDQISLFSNHQIKKLHPGPLTSKDLLNHKV